MELRQLKNFVVVAELQNINKAASQLFIAHSAISRQIQSLEEELGVKFFERHGKRLELLPEGFVFLQEARALLEQASSAKQRVSLAARGIVGNLRIGLHQVTGRHICVAEAIHAFQSANQTIEIQLIPMEGSEQIDRLRSHDLDAGIFHQPFPVPELSFLNLQSESWGIALPIGHRLADADISANDLASEKFVALARSAAPRQVDGLRAACKRAGIAPNVVLEVHDFAMLMQFVSVGIGIGFVLDSGLRRDNIVIKPVKDIVISERNSLSWRRDDDRPLVKRLVSAFTDHVRA